MLIKLSLVYRCQSGGGGGVIGILCGTVAVAQARLRGCRNDQEEDLDRPVA